MSSSSDTQITKTYTDVPETGTSSTYTMPEVLGVPRIDKINRDIAMNIRLAVKDQNSDAGKLAFKMIGKRQALMAASIKPSWRSAPKEGRRTD